MREMDRFFSISERGSSVGTEVRGGLVTFLAMAYIVAVNPAMLAEAGVPFNAALTATCFGAAVMTALMGLLANRPLALASGMGINAVVAFGLAIGQNVDWRVAMAVVFIEGIVILALVLVGLREAIMAAIPESLRKAIGVGLGIFITFIGLKSGGIVVPDEATLVKMGQVTDPIVIVAFIAIIVTILLYALRVKGEILWGIIVAVLVGFPLGVTPLPQFETFGLDFSSFGAPFQQTPDGNGMAIVQALINPTLLIFAFSLLMSDFFDTMGTAFAVGRTGEFVNEKGEIENIKEILLVDSAAAAVGGLTGASSITTYVESSAGAADGARTGLASLITALLFVLAAFLSPFIAIVTAPATTGALVMVGYLMISGVTEIDWSDFVEAFPAFMTIIGIPLTYSIANGIGLGFVSYIIVAIFSGRIRDIKPLMWVAAAAFVVAFLLN